MLEKKSKINGLCNKVQLELSPEEARVIADGKLQTLSSSKKTLLRELQLKMTMQGLYPKTIMDYTREPVVYAPGNVRATLDYNIRTGMNRTDFLNPDSITIPAGNAPIVLEVKWAAFLTSVIRDIVQIPKPHTSAFSKYAVCRMYG